MTKKRVRPNAALKLAVGAVSPERKLAQVADRLESAVELANAAEEYLAFFARVAESPKVNAVRKRVQELIKVVRGGH